MKYLVKDKDGNALGNYKSVFSQSINQSQYVVARIIGNGNNFVFFLRYPANEAQIALHQGTFCECMKLLCEKMKNEAKNVVYKDFIRTTKYQDKMTLSVNEKPMNFYSMNKTIINGCSYVICNSLENEFDNEYLFGKKSWHYGFMNFDGGILGTLDEVVNEFAKSVEAAVNELEKKQENYHEMLNVDEYKNFINGETSLKGKVVILKNDFVDHTECFGEKQLALVVSGFGANPYGSGKVFIDYLDPTYKDKDYCYRQDIAGIVSEDKLPDWAKQNLDKVKENLKAERQQER